MSKSVLIVMGSGNDLPKVKPAIDTLKSLGVKVEAKVASAHRSPVRAREIAEGARDNGVAVIIAAAGGAHHLGGAMAANTTLPVIANTTLSSTAPPAGRSEDPVSESLEPRMAVAST